MKRFIALILVTVSLFSILVSCNDGKAPTEPKTTLGITEGVDFKSIFDTGFVDSNSLAFTAESVQTVQLTDRIKAESGKLILTQPDAQADVYDVYNIETGNSFSVDFSSFRGYNYKFASSASETFVLFFDLKETASTHEKPSLWIYNESGEKIFTADEYDDFGTSALTVTLDGRMILLGEGRVLGDFKIPGYVDKDNIELGETYLSLKNGNTVSFYNESFERVSSFDFPSNARSTRVLRVGEKTALVFYEKATDPHSGSYDFYKDGVYYDAFFASFDIESGAVNEIVSNAYPLLLINESYGASPTAIGLKDSVKTLLVYSPIVDKTVLENERDMRLVAVNEDGSFGAELNSFFADQIGMHTPIPGSGCFAYQTKYGSKTVDTDGNVILTMEADDAFVPFGSGYLMVDSSEIVIYDSEFKLVKGYYNHTFVAMTNGIVIFYDNVYGRYFIADENGKEKSDIVYYGAGVYQLKNGNKIFSINGDVLYVPDVVGASVSVTASYKNVLLLRVLDGGNVKYLRISK